MLFALVVVARETSDAVVLVDRGEQVAGEDPGTLVDWLSIEPQAQLEDHRVDLLVSLHSRVADASGTITNCVAHMVVECDGHDFHEKTRAQVARDNQRDQDLQELGYLVFRFSGSQIFAEPYAHAGRVLKALRLELAHAA